MMVMKIDNSKTEEVAVEKLKTWWHIVISLDAKLSVNFEQVSLAFYISTKKNNYGTSLYILPPPSTLKEA